MQTTNKPQSKQATKNLQKILVRAKMELESPDETEAGIASALQ